MNLSKFRVTLRLGIGFGIFLMSLIIITLVSLRNITRAQDNLNQIVNDINTKIAIVSSMIDNMKDVQIFSRNIALLTDVRDMKGELIRLQAARNVYEASEARLGEIITTDEDKEMLSRARELRTAAKPLIDKAVELGMKNRDKDAASILIKDIAPITEKRISALLQIVAVQKVNASRASEEAVVAHGRARALIFILGALALVLGLVVTAASIFFALGIDSAGSVNGRVM